MGTIISHCKWMETFVSADKRIVENQCSNFRLFVEITMCVIAQKMQNVSINNSPSTVLICCYGDTGMNISCHRVRYLLPSGLCALFLYTTCTVTIMAAVPEVPPLVEPATIEHHVGKVIWADLVTPDLASSERFYAGLFGWTFRDIHFGDTDYAVAFLDGHPVAGLLQRAVPRGEHQQPAWLGFISVQDVSTAGQLALAHGAKILFGPKNYPQRGSQAIFADPDGAVFGMLASSSGDPPDVMVAPGDWIWSALLTRDPDTEAAFYQTLFGYDVFNLPNTSSVEHLILSSDNYARASLNGLPDDSSHRHPHWLNFLRVVDANATSVKAVALGGRVLVEPKVDRQGGKLAIIADPTGAVFGVMEWPGTESNQEPK